MTKWVYESPVTLRDKLHWLKIEVASIELALKAVDQGTFILLGDGPGDTCRFTGPYPTDDPFNLPELASNDITRSG